jgi:hypothetical protein
MLHVNFREGNIYASWWVNFVRTLDVECGRLCSYDDISSFLTTYNATFSDYSDINWSDIQTMRIPHQIKFNTEEDMTNFLLKFS